MQGLQVIGGRGVGLAREIGPGSVILKIKGHPIHDVLDYIYYSGGGSDLVCWQDVEGTNHESILPRGWDGEIEFAPLTVRRCSNRCIFCFIDQLPSGLRRELYVKDEDVRFSFLFGNYITLTNCSDEDIERITTQHLSPLYISVHATDPDVRERLLGIRQRRAILPVMRHLARSGIEMHGQVVLCPGLNDGRILDETLAALISLIPWLQSLAIIPVGLTDHREGLQELEIPTAEWARRTIDRVEGIQEELRDRYGDSMVYLADEFYLLAGYRLPTVKSYGSFPQLENGVGMLSRFHSQFRRRLKRTSGQKERSGETIILVTGIAAAGMFCSIARMLKNRCGIELRVLPVANRALGRRITVAGLLFGKEIIEVLDSFPGYVKALIPRVIFNRSGQRTLDDLSISEIQSSVKCSVQVIPATASGLWRAVFHRK